MTIATVCPKCRKEQEIEVDANAYASWLGGVMIQNAFPDLTSDEREQLQTGYHKTCWDAIFWEGDK
jgi:hypothetical protein